MEAFLKATDIAKILGVSRSAAYEIAAQCERVAFGTGRRQTIRVSESAFLAWLKRHERPAVYPPNAEELEAARTHSARRFWEEKDRRAVGGETETQALARLGIRTTRPRS